MGAYSRSASRISAAARRNHCSGRRSRASSARTRPTAAGARRSRADSFHSPGRHSMARWIFLLFAASGALATALVPSFAQAQAWPTKPVKIIVPAQPGGGLDLIGRTVADQLGRAFAQPIVVENVSGG